MGLRIIFLFALFALSGILFIAWLSTGKIWIGKLLGLLWVGLLGLVLMVETIGWLTSKTKLDQADYYGEYVIKRDFFKGKQTDWQYNHFRFKITDQDSIFFYVTDHEKILKTYRGSIRTTTPYKSARLIIDMEQPTHPILASNPTTYRSAWRFYLVFESPKFHNVFFEKGKWKPIE